MCTNIWQYLHGTHNFIDIFLKEVDVWIPVVIQGTQAKQMKVCPVAQKVRSLNGTRPTDFAQSFQDVVGGVQQDIGTMLRCFFVLLVDTHLMNCPRIAPIKLQ
jgi:hypothetical protein